MYARQAFDSKIKLKRTFYTSTNKLKKTKKKMGNLTEDVGCMTAFCGTYFNIVYSAVISALAVIAVLGNISVIVALQKMSSLHPPSKLLLGCLAITDLCVGMITQPLHVALLWSPQDSQTWNYIFNVFNILAFMFGGVF